MQRGLKKSFILDFMNQGYLITRERELVVTKDLILALVSEIGELAECFRWLSEEELDKILKNHEKKKKIEEEVADILYWLIIISDKLGIDMLKVLENKMEINKKRFPIEESKGVHTNPIEGSKGRR